MAQGKNQTSSQQNAQAQTQADGGFSKIVVWIVGAILVAIVAAALFGVI